MNNVQAIKRFFEADGGRRIEMQELKELSSEDRRELAVLAAEQLGEALD